MSENTAENQMAAEELAREVRIDEFAIEQFKALGYGTTLPDRLVRIYKAFKAHKDKLVPGRLSAEGFAFVCVLTDLSDGKLDLEA